jgi:hypothetical protein
MVTVFCAHTSPATINRLVTQRCSVQHVLCLQYNHNCHGSAHLQRVRFRLAQTVQLRHVLQLFESYLGSCMCTVRSMHSLSCLKRASGCIEATTASALLLALALVSVSPAVLASLGGASCTWTHMQ